MLQQDSSITMFDFAAAFAALHARCPAARQQPCVKRLAEQQVDIAHASLQCMQLAAGAPPQLPQPPLPPPPPLPPLAPATCRCLLQASLTVLSLPLCLSSLVTGCDDAHPVPGGRAAAAAAV